MVLLKYLLLFYFDIVLSLLILLNNSKIVIVSYTQKILSKLVFRKIKNIN